VPGNDFDEQAAGTPEDGAQRDGEQSLRFFIHVADILSICIYFIKEAFLPIYRMEETSW
jgi:hypothetical protein